MRPDPISPARGILHGLGYSLAMWAACGFIALLLAGGLKAGHDESKRIVAGQSENFSSFRTANGGQP